MTNASSFSGGGIYPSSSHCRLGQMPDCEWFKVGTWMNAKRAETCLWPEVPRKVKGGQLTLKLGGKSSQQVRCIATIYAQVLTDAGGRCNPRRRNARLLCNQSNHFL